MDTNKKNMERLVQSLKQATPVLKDPNDLTNSIMDQIGKSIPQKTPVLLIWTRAALSMAATVLIGLFLFQQSEAETITTTAAYIPIMEEKIEVDSTCMQLLGSEHLGIMKTYLCYMQQNSIENEQFTTHPQPKKTNQ